MGRSSGHRSGTLGKVAMEAVILLTIRLSRRIKSKDYFRELFRFGVRKSLILLQPYERSLETK